MVRSSACISLRISARATSSTCDGKVGAEYSSTFSRHGSMVKPVQRPKMTTKAQHVSEIPPNGNGQAIHLEIDEEQPPIS